MHSLRSILLKTWKSICRLPVHNLRNNSTLLNSFIYIAFYTCAGKMYSCCHVLLSDAESPTDIIGCLKIHFMHRFPLTNVSVLPCITFTFHSN